jgi:hypothetical protein
VAGRRSIDRGAAVLGRIAVEGSVRGETGGRRAAANDQEHLMKRIWAGCAETDANGHAVLRGAPVQLQ